MADGTSGAPIGNGGAGVAARAAALRVLDAVLRRGEPLEGALDKAARELERSDDRALAHMLAATVLRRTADLDALIDSETQRVLPDDAKARGALRIALAQALVLGTPQHAAIATVLPLVDGGPRRLVHGVFSAVMRRAPVLPEMPTLPAIVGERWRESWGEAVVAAAGAAIASPPPLDVTLRDLTGTIANATSLAPGHARLPAGTRVTELPGFDEGAFWVQDIAASLPARLLGPGEGQRALDLCAAPGGKTMQLAAAGWRTTAVELVAQRLARLRDNLARTRLTAETIAADALTYAPSELFDAVLLDAPCSATGIFRRHPDVLHRVRPKAIASLAERQQAMLARAAMAVKPGGRLIYAVCSLEPEEGERVAERFLESHAGFGCDAAEAAELPAGIAPDARGNVRVLPGMLVGEGGADGFFIARFRRS